MRFSRFVCFGAAGLLISSACSEPSGSAGGPPLEVIDTSVSDGEEGFDGALEETSSGPDSTVDDAAPDDGSGGPADAGDETGASDVAGSGDAERSDGSADDTAADDTAADDTAAEDTAADDTAAEDTAVDTSLPPADIVINEVSCRGREWIELLNRSPRDQDLTGWRIADGPIDLNPGFLNGKIIPALGRLVLTEGTAALPFAISCSGEVIRLSDDRLEPIDIFSFGAVPAGASAGRIPDGLGEFAPNLPTEGAPNQPYTVDDAVLYDPLSPFVVEITLPDTSITMLNADGRTYVPGQVSITLPTGEVAFSGSTGVRLKGSVGSYRTLDGKAGFKLDLAQYDAGQALYGSRKLTFNNCAQDPSFVRQWATYEVLRRSGLPAPRIGYATVFVNGAPYGLYVHIETTDDAFVNRYFPDTRLLYEGQIPADFDLANWSLFQRDIGSAADAVILAELVTALGDLPRTETWPVAAPLVDAEEVALDFAAEAWVGHWDGYAFNTNNFFAHFDGSDEKLRMFIWGVDQTLADHLNPYAEGARLQRGCLNNRDCRLLYSQKLLTISAAVRASDIPNQMLAIFEALTPEMLADPRREWTQSDAELVVNQAYDFLLSRPDEVDGIAGCEASPDSDPDGDGFGCAADCAPDNGAISPGAIDICGDGIDQDCSGRADDALDCPDCIPATRLGRSYAMCARPRTFDDARLACQAIGLDLAVPGSRGENTFLQGLLPGAWSTTAWLGFTDAAVEGTYRTVAGAIPTFTSWEAGEPNNAGNQDCTQMYTSGNWDDLDCGSLLSALCEQR